MVLKDERRGGEWAETRQLIDDVIDGFTGHDRRMFLIGFRYGFRRAADLLGDVGAGKGATDATTALVGPRKGVL